jgi:hypothetical protein
MAGEDVAMEPQKKFQKKFRVVHYVDQWPQGQTRYVLAENMNFDDAVEFAKKNIIGVSSEAMVVEDQLDPNANAFDVKSVGDGATRENPLNS